MTTPRPTLLGATGAFMFNPLGWTMNVFADAGFSGVEVLFSHGIETRDRDKINGFANAAGLKAIGIKPGDRVSIRFGTAANAEADDATTVADAFVNADSVLDEATRTLTVTGHFDPALNPGQVEQRIVNMYLAWRKQWCDLLRGFGMRSIRELVGRTDLLEHLDYL